VKIEVDGPEDSDDLDEEGRTKIKKISLDKAESEEPDTPSYYLKALREVEK
jgi:hypothetical protein